MWRHARERWAGAGLLRGDTWTIPGTHAVWDDENPFGQHWADDWSLVGELDRIRRLPQVRTIDGLSHVARAREGWDDLPFVEGLSVVCDPAEPLRLPPNARVLRIDFRDNWPCAPAPWPPLPSGLRELTVCHVGSLDVSGLLLAADGLNKLRRIDIWPLGEVGPTPLPEVLRRLTLPALEELTTFYTLTPEDEYALRRYPALRRPTAAPGGAP